MKKTFIILIILSLFFISCKNTISYELRNNTDYDVTLIDNSTANYPEYFLKAHTVIAIDHYDSASFSLKENTYPVEVVNGFSSTSVDTLQNITVNVYNNTDKDFVMNVLNTSHISTSSFSISAKSEKTFLIYCKSSPIIELQNENENYNNYVFNNNCINIF